MQTLNSRLLLLEVQEVGTYPSFSPMGSRPFKQQLDTYSIYEEGANLKTNVILFVQYIVLSLHKQLHSSELA